MASVQRLCETLSLAADQVPLSTFARRWVEGAPPQALVGWKFLSFVGSRTKLTDWTSTVGSAAAGLTIWTPELDAVVVPAEVVVPVEAKLALHPALSAAPKLITASGT